MTKKFEKAKAETIQKFSGVLDAIRLAEKRERGRCGFCRYYGSLCRACPIDDLCAGELHKEVIGMLFELEGKVIEGLSLLEKVKEK